ncbi:carbohydrate kinase family protein [Mucilaginibacter psychrotolerans]|uniref:Carbohydrate kinase n=1 Tax=Mucilaginibacter psychrotolerans TaxID=1524096 RepID=A0A4Y8SR10_9SPHI|nr:carbohydrate kinase [Mucilaginibacter psychrotolerans]TFF40834.1 carbohydrate kinase [Mucilaginibacter psychrotolerans]
MNKQILCFGEVLWDAFGDVKKAGGAPMNVARHLVQQGNNVLFASSVGTDASGNELTTFLQENGLFSELIQRDEKLPTCEVTVQLDENNTATYIIPQPVSWDNIGFTEPLEAASKKVGAIVFGSLACREQASFETLLNVLDESDALKIFDVNLRPPHFTMSTIETLAARADVIKMNEEEAELLIHGSSGDLKQKIEEFQSKFHTKIICVTRGEHGAIIWNDYQYYEHPGCKVCVVDTVGAGDSFLATFITGLLNGTPMQALLEKSCAVGAYVTTQRGANPVYNVEEVVAQFS